MTIQYYTAWLTKNEHRLIHITENTQETLCRRWITKDGRWYFDSGIIDTKQVTCKLCLKRYNERVA